MNQQIASTASGNNGETSPHDLFALTDEQILEIEPEAQDTAVARDPWPVTREEKSGGQSQAESGPASSAVAQGNASEKVNIDAKTTATSSSTDHGTRDTERAVEPPPWLAAQMKDPWTGEQAKELWNGVQQAKSEAAAYRAAFANPEDARALKELYPGGVNEARAASERARVLDDIDRAYFGAAGKSAQEVSASRAQLAQQMLREDPAAFREMVFAGLRALEDSANVGPTLGSPGADGDASANEAHVAAYAAFEKAANDDLERSVGATIERTLQHALPNVARGGQDAPGRAGQAPPLQARLSQAIRQDVEAALKGDRQLSEQVAQILSGRRLDGETRQQVVRLIGERAQQLVPVAAKRVLNDWTRATLAAHRGESVRADATSARREVAPASPPAGSAASSNRAQTQAPNRSASRSDPRRVDYRKLSDEQILDL